VIHVLFPLGIRLSTILAALAFIGLAIARRDKLPLIAAWLWVTTFEAVFQIASLIMNRLPIGLFPAVFFLTLAAITLPLLGRKVTPNWWFLAAALVVIGIWMATGFHLNGHQHGLFSLHPHIPHLDVVAEICNELSKTLWALAYFLPLVRSPVSSGTA
jgi:hypothetical protein